MLGIKWCPEAEGATAGGLEGSALAGIWTGGAPSNKRDNVGASDTCKHTDTHRYSAINTSILKQEIHLSRQKLEMGKINPVVDAMQGHLEQFQSQYNIFDLKKKKKKFSHAVCRGGQIRNSLASPQTQESSSVHD